MKKLVLNKSESLELQRDGAVHIVRNGFFEILVELEKDFIDGDYRITIVNPYGEVVVNKNK